ncbi:DUF1351 domain-containing protein [[Clostridium] innocuum]|nr:DUF1351 domain-containing protein [[Clostridium] innocuum]
MKYEIELKQGENGLFNNAEQILSLVQGDEYKKYNYIVTENNYDDAKEDKKKLKAELESAKRNRIDFEKKINEEWNPVKATLMKAEKIVETYVKSLDDGISSLDEKKKEERRSVIKDFFLEIKGDLDIPFDKVLESGYLTKSCSTKKWQEGITRKVNDFRLDYELLGNMDVEDKVLLQTIFKQEWNRQRAIDEYNHQMNVRKKAEELRKAKEAQNIKEKCAKESQEEKIEESQNPVLDVPDARSVSKMVVISGSELAWVKAKEYMQSIGLKVEEVI